MDTWRMGEDTDSRKRCRCQQRIRYHSTHANASDASCADGCAHCAGTPSSPTPAQSGVQVAIGQMIPSEIVFESNRVGSKSGQRV